MNEYDPQKEYERRVRRNRIEYNVVIATATSLVVLAPLLLGVLMATRTHVSTPGSGDITRLQEITGVRFPEGAKLVRSEYSPGARDSHIFALVEIDRADTGVLLQGMHLSPVETGAITRDVQISRTDRVESHFEPGTVRILPDALRTWWRPDSVQPFTAVEIVTHDEICSVLIGTGGERRVPVYLRWGTL